MTGPIKNATHRISGQPRRLIVDRGINRRSLITLAYFEDDPDARGEGRSTEEALGNLIWIYGQKWGIDIVKVD